MPKNNKIKQANRQKEPKKIENNNLFNNIKKIKDWISSYNIEYVDLSNLTEKRIFQEMLISLIDDKMLVFFVVKPFVPSIIKDYIDITTKSIYKCDDLLLNALFIYKNNVKIITNFMELKKSSLEQFIIRDTECPICFTEYKDFDVRNGCYKCSYHICLSCFKTLNQCPICNTEHEKI